VSSRRVRTTLISVSQHSASLIFGAEHLRIEEFYTNILCFRPRAAPKLHTFDAPSFDETTFAWVDDLAGNPKAMHAAVKRISQRLDIDSDEVNILAGESLSG